MIKKNRISIVWDFDGTLTPKDSTSITVNHLTKKEKTDKLFWKYVKTIQRRGNNNVGKGKKGLTRIEEVLSSDAPTWMFALSRLAFVRKVPLNFQFFNQYIAPHVQLFPGVISFLNSIKNLSCNERYKKQHIEIHHFIVSAGLKDLIDAIFKSQKGLFTETFGCRYEITFVEERFIDEPESIPVFCMDETMKTRAIFDICKGTFDLKNKDLNVNKKLNESELWCPFENLIYIGDGPTDIPALSLTRGKGGLGIVVFNPKSDKNTLKKRLENMSLDQRADLITPANFTKSGDLYKYIKSHIYHILQKIESSQISTVLNKN